MSKSILSSRALALTLLSCTFISSAALAARDGDTQPQAQAGSTPATTTPATTPIMMFPTKSRSEEKQERLKKLNLNMLHRLDFRVEGSGCAACLGRVRKKIDKLKGILEVAIAIKKPYGCAVLYDSSKIDMDTIIKEGKKDEGDEVKFIDFVDKKIENPPLILVPIYTELLK
ncbi:MAG: cation transporter [Candidatus Obscuribacterales bacterium]|nr:cation transporter [Candidatus Obscuribacterales bacterium]